MRDQAKAASERWVSVAVGVFVAAAFCVIVSGVSGPAYLRDEIGYLSNAAFLGGRHVAGASSYYAGYSLLLAPLFYFFDHPARVWQGVMLVNAALWGGTLALLHASLRRLFPQLRQARLLFALLLVAAYPANVVMSGYAFSQSAVAFVFMASVASLFAVEPARPRSVVVHAICAGLLSWVHPLGLVAPLASWLALWPAARAAGNYRVLAWHALITLGLVLLYRYGVDPWRIAGMTPAGASAELHYPTLRNVGAALASPTAWLTPLATLLGQLSYSAVASFGVTIIAAITIVREAGRSVTDEAAPSRTAHVRWYVLLAPLACIAATALSTAHGQPTRLDHWLYGRYQDVLILPLLAYGLLCEKRRWSTLATALVVAVLVLLIGLWISHGMHAGGAANRVNFPGLWPEPFLPAGSIALWLAWGAAGIVAFHVLPRNLAWCGALLLYACSIHSQRQWHLMLLDKHSNPSEVVDFVRGNFPRGCVYFDEASIATTESMYSPLRERALLYSFYLFDLQYDHGTDAAGWENSACRGALLSYNAQPPQKQTGLHLVGRETSSGLRVWVKDDPAALRYPPRTTRTLPESDWITWMSASCLRSGDCFRATAPTLLAHTQVGRLNDAVAETSGRAGFLFFGPYRPLRAGRYELSLNGQANTATQSYVDVVAEGGRASYLKQTLASQAAGPSLGRWQFDLPHDVGDVQVRLWVGEGDQLAISSYTVNRVDGVAVH